MKIYDFFKAVVNACNDSDLTCKNCPILTIKHKKSRSCRKLLFNYIIETDKAIGQKIYDELVRLDIDEIPYLGYCEDKKRYEEQLKVFEKYCKNNSLEIE